MTEPSRRRPSTWAGRTPWTAPLSTEITAVESLSRSGSETLVRVPDVDTLTRLLAATRQSGGKVLSVWPYRETLEDLFMKEVAEPAGERNR